MRRGPLPALASAFLAIALVGCGASTTTTTGDSGDEGEQGRKVRIAELEKRPGDVEREDESPSGPMTREFDSFARTLDGEVGLTMGDPVSGDLVQLGNIATAEAWSTIKVPIALSVLKRAKGPSGLNAEQRSDIELALTASDNDAAMRLFESLGSIDAAAQSVTGVLREAGDRSTEVSTVGRDGFSPYGQTDWPLAEQHRLIYWLATDCSGDRASRDYVLELMGRVTSDTWGLGATGSPARWKGGWGPDVDGRYLVRQMGVLDGEDGELVVTLAARAEDETLESAQGLATAVAEWAAENGSSFTRPSAGC
jgi:hypothetical protein